MSKILGIDLGTTNSEAAIMEGGKVTLIQSAEGKLYFPSVVAFSKDGEKLVGEVARRQAVLNHERTIREIKREIGTAHQVTIGNKTYTPQQISAFILQKMKTDAEAYLGEAIKKAVITVPAYFDDDQRTATKDAGRIAGLEVLRIINEPTAAALAYGLEKKGENKIAVFDFGGGTFDITLMEAGDGVFEVLSTNGDTHLGGTDIDQRIVDWLADGFQKQFGIDLRKDPQAHQRLIEAAEQAKIELSTTLKTTINLPFITATSEGPKHLNVDLTRAKFEELAEPIINRCIPPCKQALADAKLKPKDIDKVILVGASTRTPLVQQKVEGVFGKKPERDVDPMQCVAEGAAIQGAVLSGEAGEIVLLDVTPLTLGIETLGGVRTPLISRNTTIPTRKSQIFSTAADFQTQVEINVLQGERSMAVDNKSLGRFILNGVPPAPRGIPQIDVTFDIDANGIVNVSAKDKATGKEQKITITASVRLPEEEVERMQKEAERFAEEDKRRKEEVETRNQADTLVYTAEKTLKELGDKIDKQDKERVENSVKELRSALTGDDLAKIKAGTDKLSKVLQEVGAKIYQAQAQPPPGKGAEEAQEGKEEWKGHPSGKEGGETIDADYKVKKDKEKKDK
ncbi:MAG TPA: molecular chaperone DnaK [Thermoplasmata archaeon]|nr:molecular chaperone DnaK [Thermoplasmata archaeon]